MISYKSPKVSKVSVIWWILNYTSIFVHFYNQTNCLLLYQVLKMALASSSTVRNLIPFITLITAICRPAFFHLWNKCHTQFSDADVIPLSLWHKNTKNNRLVSKKEEKKKKHIRYWPPSLCITSRGFFFSSAIRGKKITTFLFYFPLGVTVLLIFTT